MLNNNAIRWIVGILVVFSLITSFYHAYSFYDISRGLDDITKDIEEITSPYTQYDEQEARIEERLTERGYEVFSVNIMNYTNTSNLVQYPEWYGLSEDFFDLICNSSDNECWERKVGVHVTMKSLGNRNEQILDVLITMYARYPNAFTYGITIKSPTDTCDYLLFGATYREYSSELSKVGTEEENLTLARELQENVQYQIDFFEDCS